MPLALCQVHFSFCHLEAGTSSFQNLLIGLNRHQTVPSMDWNEKKRFMIGTFSYRLDLSIYLYNKDWISKSISTMYVHSFGCPKSGKKMINEKNKCFISKFLSKYFFKALVLFWCKWGHQWPPIKVQKTKYVNVEHGAEKNWALWYTQYILSFSAHYLDRWVGPRLQKKLFLRHKMLHYAHHEPS